jgi:adhesin transport system membrane fusion protein|tara:strand:- start:2383 stop:3666 length:1284 start_codon:yes stop_codon:yes gene_type:complete
MDPSQNDGSGSRDYFMIFTVTLIFGVFLVWANFTHLDLVTRGGGRVIAAGQNKNVQSPERGTIATYMVEEGSIVSVGQIIATINPIEAAGVLEELEARLANLNIRLVRLDAELQSKPVSVVMELSSSYSKALVGAEVELMISRKASLDAELETLNQDRKKTIKAMMSLDAQISGRKVMQGLLVEEMKEVLPLVEAGALGSSERFRLERQDASISTELEVLTEEKAQTKVTIEQIASKTDTVQQDYKTNIYQERSEVIGEISELEARLPAIRQRLKETDIRSPIDGIVNRVFYNNVGAVVGGGEIVAEIVPTGGDVLVEAFIDPKDIATVEPGQKVKISLTAYDPSKYGYLLGTLTKVAADTVFREETRTSDYAVNASIDSVIYEDDETPVTIFPGMVASVDIIRGNRSILEYFWQPVAKIKDTAFRE